ncbi:replication initiator protein A [Candidatus Bipolaricaulota bacterium]|nr:replication initiator protein A [Candidatus Bipolaricaulota bacterium]
MFQTAKTIIEKKEEEKKTSPNKGETLPSEVNFLVLPFFSLSREDSYKKDGLEYRQVVERDDKTEEVVWKVSPSQEYGYPRITDKKVFKAVEQLLRDRGYPIENPVTFSIYKLLNLMGKKSYGGRDYREVRESLERLVATTIKSKGTFYYKDEKRYLDEVFHLFSRVVFSGEKLPDGEEAEKNYLYLNSWLLENLNKYYVRPLDYEYYKSLDGALSKRLYELLGVKFFGLIKQGKPFLRYRYANLCALMPLKKQSYLSRARQILDPAHRELKGKNFFSGVDWEPREAGGGWYLRYEPGSKIKREVEGGSS